MKFLQLHASKTSLILAAQYVGGGKDDIKSKASLLLAGYYQG